MIHFVSQILPAISEIDDQLTVFKDFYRVA